MTSSPQYKPDAIAKIKSHFDSQGYVHLKKIIPANYCENIVKAYREISSNDLLNRITDRRIKKIQPIQKIIFDIYNSNPLKNITDKIAPGNELYDDVYFQKSQGFDVHQDIIQEPTIENMLTMWIALEDVTENNGGIYVYPSSQLLKKDRIYHTNHQSQDTTDYSSNLEQELKNREVGKLTPKINKGDIVLWDGWTAHGSHQRKDRYSTRHSLILFLKY